MKRQVGKRREEIPDVFFRQSLLAVEPFLYRPFYSYQYF
jgi:hypothetical protein